MKKAFTLIELLIVVAIIAILAAIAVPNFLEAQTRAKVSRTKSDMRTLATAIESYAVDNNRIPREFNYGQYGDVLVNPQSGSTVTGLSGIMWWGVSTPIAYITSVYFPDVFQDKNYNAALDEQYYTYQDLLMRQKNGLFSATFAQAAIDFYGTWRMISVGPDKLFAHPGVTNSVQLAYDPTNGTVSMGNIFRSQSLSESREPVVGTLIGPH
ncbi:MAG: type II secretion system protein GspG [Candidatus Sumerlaeaceae bacterium]|nr:type II secretion system protein GspG [Candidatus Sumerlaeaceae bacterium]